MKRGVAGLAAIYLCVALVTRLAEAMGLRTCGCAADCWCRKPLLSAFRWVFPRGHKSAWSAEEKATLNA